MIFIPLLLLGIFLYFNGKQISSLLVFFFFLTTGFELIPESFFSIGVEIKPMDFAIVYLISILLILYLKKYEFPKQLPKYTVVLILYILLTCLISYFVYKIPLHDIIRTSRIFLLLLFPLFFSTIKQENKKEILLVLFNITLIQSIVYFLQVLTSTPLLNGYAGMGPAEFLGIDILRFYNTPFFVLFFVFYAMYNNPYVGKLKILTIIIVHIPIFLSLSRSLLVGYIIVQIIGYLIYYHISFKTARNFIIIGVLLLPIILGFAVKFFSETVVNDIDNLASKEFLNVETTEEFGDATLSFRFAHLYERADYVFKKPITTIFGAGWMHEDSKYTQRNFDFIIGLRDEKTNDTVQIETSDIAWSLMILRLGIVGIFIYMVYYIKLMHFFTTINNKKETISSFLYLLLLLIISFTSVTFFDPSALIIVFVLYSILFQQYVNEEINV